LRAVVSCQKCRFIKSALKIREISFKEEIGRKQLIFLYSIKTWLSVAVRGSVPNSLKMPHHPALPEWQNLEDQIAGLQHLCQNHGLESAVPSECLSGLEDLCQQIQGQMSPSSNALTLPGATQRHMTELHRLVRLSLTDVALWQGARSPQLQQQRFEQLLNRLTLLHQHAHAIVVILAAG
jgi:hypothetical protein